MYWLGGAIGSTEYYVMRKRKAEELVVLSESQLHSRRARSLWDRQQAEANLDGEHQRELDELIDLEPLVRGQEDFGRRLTEGFRLLGND